MYQGKNIAFISTQQSFKSRNVSTNEILSVKLWCRKSQSVSKNWSKNSTKLFYQSLSQMGIDFDTTSQLFPGLRKQEIKAKYNRETSANPRTMRRIQTDKLIDWQY
jgi:hypothetical protein